MKRTSSSRRESICHLLIHWQHSRDYAAVLCVFYVSSLLNMCCAAPPEFLHVVMNPGHGTNVILWYEMSIKLSHINATFCTWSTVHYQCSNTVGKVTALKERNEKLLEPSEYGSSSWVQPCWFPIFVVVVVVEGWSCGWRHGEQDAVVPQARMSGNCAFAVPSH